MTSEDKWLWFNVVLCLACLTYLYHRLDKEVSHVYRYAKTLDDSMVQFMSDIEGKHANLSEVQDTQT